jgi:hypothetical protein
MMMMMMKIGDVGGLVSASGRAVFACAELWHGFQTGNSAKVDQWADNGGSNQHRNLVASQ